MPKLDLIHIAERLKLRLEDLKAGKDVAAREIRALLTNKQLLAMDLAWKEQQALRKKRREKTKVEGKNLSWKSKREVFIEAYENALAEASNQQADTWERRSRAADVRQARIFLESYAKAIDEGKSSQAAKNIANNNLTRSGLRRFDGKTKSHSNKRDKEVSEIESALRKKLGINEE